MTDLWQAGDEELLLALGAARSRVNETYAAMLPLVSEIQSRGLAGERGYRDTAELVHDVQNVTRGAARALVGAADDLTPGRTPTGGRPEPSLPALAAAVAEAAVSAEHVAAIRRVLASLPPHLDAHRAGLEAELTEHARTLDPDAVARLGKRAIALLDPDGPRPRDPAPARNRLTLRAHKGGFEARGWFDTESAAALRTALSPLTAPTAPLGPHGRGCVCHPATAEASPGPAAGRAIGDGRRCSGDAGAFGHADGCPECAGVIGTTAGRATGRTAADVPGVAGVAGAADAAATDQTATEDDAEHFADPAVCPSVEHRDPRSRAERDGDGLVELARRLIATGELGREAGQAVQVTVTVPLEVLESRLGAGLLGLGDGTLSAAVDAETARRLACDARVVPIVLGSAGEPIDVGREYRLANRAQRRALAQRDGGCAFPGCDCPPQWCIAHHIVHWADHGRTELSNLVLLCPRHHTVIHTQEWEITMDGGFPLFHPPPWIPGGPRRNRVHRPDLLGTVPRPRPSVRLLVPL